MRHSAFTFFVAFSLLAVTTPMAWAADAYTIVFNDGTFTPNRIEVPAGQTVKIVLRNEGKTAVEFESRSLRKETLLRPGGRSEVILRSPAAGQYDFFDDFRPDAGKGVIVVK